MLKKDYGLPIQILRQLREEMEDLARVDTTPPYSLKSNTDDNAVQLKVQNFRRRAAEAAFECAQIYTAGAFRANKSKREDERSKDTPTRCSASSNTQLHFSQPLLKDAVDVRMLSQSTSVKGFSASFISQLQSALTWARTSLLLFLLFQGLQCVLCM